MLEKQRVLPIKSGINFRELGGYRTTDGKQVKFRKVIRSAKLSELNHKDLAYLQDYGLIIDVDFRSDDEIEQEPDKLPDGTEYQHLPVFAVDQTENSKSPQELADELRFDTGAGHRRMVHVYQNMITQDSAQLAYRRFFGALLRNERADQALLFHCTAGKDRTGMGAFFLLSALGVDQQTIEGDYLLTNQTYKPETEALIAQASDDHSTPEMLDNLRALFSVHPDFIHAAEHEIQNLAGDTVHYLKDYIGLSDGDFKDLRRIYLDK